MKLRRIVSLAAVAAVTWMSARAADGPAKPLVPRPPYQRMEFGPVLFWTLEVAPGNIAYKGIAVRLDAGAGGVSKGRAWMIYDHDTLRVAAAVTGSFVDWRGIAFDGSHETLTRLTGVRHFVNPVGPGWADAAGRWEEPRLRGRDGLPYGPLPRDWAHYSGLYLSGEKVVWHRPLAGTCARILVGSSRGPILSSRARSTWRRRGRSCCAWHPPVNVQLAGAALCARQTDSGGRNFRRARGHGCSSRGRRLKEWRGARCRRLIWNH
jgi:hypothetical protein